MATLLCAGALGAVGHSALAANDVWIGNTDANFATLANWTGSVSPNNNTPVFGGAGTAGATLNNDIVGATYAGFTFNSGASAYTIGGNSFTLSGNIVNNSTSAQTINNAITLNNAAHTFSATSGNIALNGGISGATTQGVTFNGTNTTTLAGTNTFNTKGANFSAFTVNAGGKLSITGATTVDGTGFTDYRGYLDLSGSNSSITVQTGGSLSINTSTGTGLNSGIGNNVTGTATLTLNGGNFSLNGNTGFMLGNNRADATGVLTITSGTATINRGSTTATDNRSFIAIGRDLANGTINLNGGVLATDRNFVRDGSGATANGGTANFNFGGGTLKALADQTDWLNSSLKNTNQQALSAVTATGTSTIDANGFSVAINNNITGTGGFTVNSSTGTGTVTFGGANAFTGATTVTNGTLALSSTGSLASTAFGIGAGAHLDVSAKSSFSLSGAAITLTLDGSSIGMVDAASLAVNFAGAALTLNLTTATPGASYDYLPSLTSSGTGDLASVDLTGSSFSGSLTRSGNIWSGVSNGYSFSLDQTSGALSITAVPEPHEFAVAIMALLGVMVFIRRRNQQV
jgi:autotransporter-associated beta strand protein